jgi:hypothetical protein
LCIIAALVLRVNGNAGSVRAGATTLLRQECTLPLASRRERRYHSRVIKSSVHGHRPMKSQQIEAWALRVIERVESKQNAEDTLVELKSIWPDDLNRAARQLGGHAIAARGESILWLIGVDEKAGKVVGAPLSQFADWYPAVEKEFDGLAPRCTPLNIPHEHGTVVALLIETDRAPYVVRNAFHGKSGGGSVAFEVPWRDGALTRSAKRADLLRLLTPATKLPEVELLAAGLWAQETHGPNRLTWRLDVYLFVTPLGETPVVIAAHRCESSVTPAEAGGYALPLGEYSFGSDTPGNARTKSAVTVHTPGLVIISAQYVQNSYTLPLTSQKVQVVGKARPVGADATIDWSCELARRFPERTEHAGIWGIGSFTSF